MRVVIDTIVLVSAVINPGGAPADVLEAWEKLQFSWIMTPALFEELADVLWRDSMERFVVRHPGRREWLMASARDMGEWFNPTVEVQVIRSDPDDDRLLEAAHEGNADLIVTGDRHLLELGEYKGTRIVTPIEFLVELRFKP